MPHRCVRIVEDSTALAEMLSVMLGFEKIRHTTTSDNFGMLLRPEPWEGVTTALCDLDLGGHVTGETILEYLREKHPWIHRVVLSATAHVGYEDRIQSLANVVLLKPASIETIVASIK